MAIPYLNRSDLYPFIDFHDPTYSHNLQAAHCCIYSPYLHPLFKGYENKAYVSMQMRFDGCLGFPGGYINKNDSSVVDGLNRELVEEINLDTKHFVTQEDYLFSNLNVKTNARFHFYKKEVSVADFLQIERNILDAKDYGKEVMGPVRVPLFSMSDGIKGFPLFLSNNFAGNAKFQLLNFLIECKLISLEDAKSLLPSSEK